MRRFCFHRFVNRRMAEQKLLKMKNDFHLKDAGWILKVSPYLNLEKGMELCKNCQVSGDFCLEQIVFL